MVALSSFPMFPVVHQTWKEYASRACMVVRENEPLPGKANQRPTFHSKVLAVWMLHTIELCTAN